MESEKTITRAEHLQMLGLMVLGMKYKKLADETGKAMCALAGDDDDGYGSGHIGDALWSADEPEKALNEALRKMKIEVVDG